MDKTIKYFDKPGPINTNEIINAIDNRAKELQIEQIVLATRVGHTALQIGEHFKMSNINIVAITHQYGYMNPGEWLIDDEIYRQLQDLNVKVVTATMPLTSPGKLFRPHWRPDNYPTYNTLFPYDIIADTLRIFSQGMKVCVEIIAMAADMGLISIDNEVISVAGTNRGADTAVVAKPAHLQQIYDLRILEIIAMPRLTHGFK